MPLSLHPNAQAAFDENAEQLLVVVRERFSLTERTGNPFLVLDGNPVQADVAWESLQDSNIPIAVAFEVDVKTIRIEGDDFLPIIHLAEQLQRRRELSEAVSVNAILNVLVSWFRQRILSDTDSGFVQFLLSWVEEHVSERTVIFPIFELRFAGTLVANGVEIRQLEHFEIDEWYAGPLSDSEWRKGAEETCDYWRSQIGGWAAAFVTVVAEPKHAYEAAYEKVEAVLSLLRSFSPAMLIPEGRSYCTVYGMEQMQQRIAFSLDAAGSIGVSHPTLASQATWSLNEEAIRDLASCGLLNALQLLELERPTKFQKDILHALMLYSRAASEPLIESKLLYIVAAIDFLLLVDNKEPIISALSRRFPYAVGRDLTERLEVQGRFKSAYDMRSGFVHHGKSIDDHLLAKAFMRDAWHFFRQIVLEGEKYGTRQDYIKAMEDEMLAGPSKSTE